MLESLLNIMVLTFEDLGSQLVVTPYSRINSIS